MTFLVARAEKHMWEEPVLSGKNGSGTIFFGGCVLHCAFCQNYEISHKSHGLMLTESELKTLFFKLQDDGAENINLVTPSHYALKLAPLLESIKHKLKIPIVYNSSGYDTLDALKRLCGLVDVYLPDLKYAIKEVSLRYSKREDYFEKASKAIEEMRYQQRTDCFKNGLIKRGVIVRHLVLPSNLENTFKVLDFLALLDRGIYVSLMAQYFPTAKASEYPEINRRLTKIEYNAAKDYFFKIGLRNGFMQDLSSGIKDYVPSFDLKQLKAKLGEN